MVNFTGVKWLWLHDDVNYDVKFLYTRK